MKRIIPFLVIIGILVLIACVNSLKEKNVPEPATTEDLKEQQYQKEASTVMNVYHAETGWEKESKTTVGFANVISDRTIAVRGIVKDVYYENGNYYAMVYAQGTANNSFVFYAKLNFDQPKILSSKNKPRGYFAIHVGGILQGKPDIESYENVISSPVPEGIYTLLVNIILIIRQKLHHALIIAFFYWLFITRIRNLHELENFRFVL